MALFIASLKCGATIEGVESVSVSYPDFFKDMKSLGVHLRSIEG